MAITATLAVPTTTTENSTSQPEVSDNRQVNVVVVLPEEPQDPDMPEEEAEAEAEEEEDDGEAMEVAESIVFRPLFRYKKNQVRRRNGYRPVRRRQDSYYDRCQTCHSYPYYDRWPTSKLLK